MFLAAPFKLSHYILDSMFVVCFISLYCALLYFMMSYALQAVLRKPSGVPERCGRIRTNK